MRRLTHLRIVTCIGILVAPAAVAHRLVPDEGTHTSPDTAIFLNDVDLSQVVYHEVTDQSNHLWIAFDAASGQNLYWQLGLPAIEGLEEYCTKYESDPAW